MMVFASNSGNCAMDILLSENNPNIAQATNMSVVVTGCLTAER